MANWTHITEDDVRSAGHGLIIDKARSTAAGSTDPLLDAIGRVTARVRGAVASGNAMDADPAKVPNSLAGDAISLVFYRLCRRIGWVLSEDQQKDEAAINRRLNQIQADRIAVEQPDTPAGQAEMQTTGGAEAVNLSPRLTGRDKTAGL